MEDNTAGAIIMHSTKNKYSPQSTNVKQMFNEIAPKYDFLNHFLSAGIDKRWRKKTVDALKKRRPEHILDIATGTGDMAIRLLDLNPKNITGIDISEKMMAIGKLKVDKLNESKRINFIEASSENIPFNENSFDAITVAFGVRNFRNLHSGLSEMHRVLKPEAVAAILEFSMPKQFPMRQLIGLYFKIWLPMIGRLVSKSPTAYSYLPKTISNFPQGEQFAETLLLAGFSNVSFKRFTFGIATLYIAEK